MAKKTHDLAVVVGEYTDRNGDTKKRYQNVGALMEGDRGPYIMLAKWFNPAGVQDSRGGESLILSCFEPRQANNAQHTEQKPANNAKKDEEYSEDIPF